MSAIITLSQYGQRSGVMGVIVQQHLEGHRLATPAPKISFTDNDFVKRHLSLWAALTLKTLTRPATCLAHSDLYLSFVTQLCLQCLLTFATLFQGTQGEAQNPTINLEGSGGEKNKIK